jgi:DNA-binding transcriptional LysR family regulator
MAIPDFINLRHLYALAEIARQRSVRRAAMIIHLSQPAVTQALAHFETMLQQRLFERTATGMTPTQATSLLADRIDRAFAWLMAADRVLGGAAPLHRRVTRVQLQSLMAAVDSESISLAARKLGVRQPSVTRALRDLETLCGRQLFTRSPHGIDASREARELARFAGLAFAEIQQGLDVFRESHGQIDGRIVVGSLPLARSALLPTAVTKLLDRHPEVKLKIVDGPYAELLHELRFGHLDCIVGALRFPPPADVQQEELFRDPLSIAVRPGHPLLTRESLGPDDFAGLDWILPPEGTPAREHFSSFFDAMTSRPPRHIVECSSLIAVRGLLLRSDRAALLSAAQVRYEVRSGQLAMLGGPLAQTARPIGLALRADWRPTVAQGDFLDLLRSSVAESIAA